MERIQLLALAIPAIPLLGFFLNGVVGGKMPGILSGVLSTLLVAASFGLSGYVFLQLNEFSGDVFIAEWFEVGSWKINLAFLIDPLSVMMMLVITGIGTLIHLYSIGYMKGDERFPLFFAYLNLFVFFMLILVMGNSLLLMFIGWEGVGLCSYLLIGFWFHNTAYNLAAKKAFVMNRIGDVGFVMAMFFVLQHIGSLEYSEILSFIAANGLEVSLATSITLLLFVAATGKSAQVPLYTWLPDAMAGPTPVSALIHAATMVTAGIYLVVRLHPLFELAPQTLEVIMWIGVATCLLGALIGLRQNDIKKVLAYSTVSQLGLIFGALGAGVFQGAMFHLFTHAFFKALLFLGAGSVIHALGGEQDIRKMGGLAGKIKITFITFLIATIAISGIPPFSGFFSKDEILAGVFEHNPVAWILLQFASLLTVFYMFRLVYLVFFGKFRGDAHTESHIHESPFSMSFPLILLAICSLAAGWIGIPHIFGFHHYLQAYLEPVLGVHEMHADESTEWMLMGIATGGALLVIALATFVYRIRKSVPAQDADIKGFAKFVYNKFYVDELYRLVISRPMLWMAEKTYFWIERRTVDGLVNGSGNLLIWTGKKLSAIQSGNAGWYIFAMTIGIILILILQFWMV